MRSPPGFDDFVAARSPRLLRIAYLLTRDWALAEDLLQTALAEAWSVWQRIQGDPEPYVRKIIANTYASWWRRRWTAAEHPTDHLPEQPMAADRDAAGQIDDRDRLWQALGRLPRRQRAVLVLRYFEDLSTAEIADVLGRSGGTCSARNRGPDGRHTAPREPTGQRVVHQAGLPGFQTGLGHR